jgi:hypothetical protein
MPYNEPATVGDEVPLAPLEEPAVVRFARWCEGVVESMLRAVENQHGLWYIGIFQDKPPPGAQPSRV